MSQTDIEIVDAGGLVKISGTVEHITYQNDDNGFCICDICNDKDEIITVLGSVPYPMVGDYYIFYGRWTHNAKYGRQFKAEQFEKSLSSDKAAILKYLSSRAIKGIGARMAQRIVAEFGEDTFDVIENHPDWLADIKGISLKKAQEISADFKEKAGMRSAMMYFGEFFGPTLSVRIFKKWGSGAVDIAKNNPYRLCDEIDGIGFEKADEMARKIGFPEDSADRLKSGTVYILKHNAAQNGHTCLPRETLAKLSAQMMGTTEEYADEIISQLIKEKRLYSMLCNSKSYIFDEYTYNCEKTVAAKLTQLDKICIPVNITDVYAFLAKEEMQNGISYADQQRNAIAKAMTSGVLILTGGPGTGKTTVVKALLDIFKSMGFKVALAAPTGRAAKRLSESTQCEAKTVHRLLEMAYSADDATAGEGEKHSEFMRNEDNHLEENVVIVDEVSMIDVYLMNALVKAIKPGARLILIGDVDQLPSVGAGDVLRDLIDCERFSVVRLVEIFRQAQSSLIVTNSHEINLGNMPSLDVKDNDFFFLPRPDSEIAATISDLCRNRLPKAYGSEFADGIQVISPSRRGVAGTDSLNHLLQQALNPPSAQKAEYRHREITYRVGDKVMQIRNNYDLEWEKDDTVGYGIFNGDIGIIEAIDRAEQVMHIRFDDRTVLYDLSMLDDITQAFAITVHKSQGSEYPTVIIPMYSAPPMLLTRNLLYTAVTRAQKMVILVGNSDIVRRMVENDCQALRYTGLYYRLKA
ncbi:MAG: ATP-dependent RecD-like DNA helicase [Clostridia bacterium]|nr:ATP-dependent RecD-like DNA helicase [Clostridia bacterium]